MVSPAGTSPAALGAGAARRGAGGPLLGWLSGYSRAWLRADVLAGLTAAAVVLPKAMAYATIAGLPVEVGLYTALFPVVVYAVLGDSRVLSVTTTTTIAILAAAALGNVAPGATAAQLATAAGTLSLLAGLMLLGAGVLRLGFVANFISEPVLAGFKAGIGVVIVADQLPKLLGLHIHKAGFFRDLVEMGRRAGDISLPTLLFAVATAAVILGMKRWAPRLPAPLFAVALGIAATGLFHLGDLGVQTIGAVSGGLPSLVKPDLDLLRDSWPAAVGIALMSFTETIACGRAFAGASEHRPSPNRELVATGLANLAGGLFGAMPSGGGASQTAVNRSAGAHTQVAGLVTAGASLATLLFLAPAISLLPQATLATVVVIYSAELVSLREFRAIGAIRRLELLWSLTSLAGVVFLGTLRGILIAVITSLLALVHQANNPPVYALGRKPGTNVFRRRSGEHPEDETYPGILMVRVEGRIYFGNAERVLDQMADLIQEANPRVIVLECSAILDLEYSALKMLAEAERRVREHGMELWIADLNPAVHRVVERAPLGQTLGRERTFFDLEHAVKRYLSQPAAQ